MSHLVYITLFGETNGVTLSRLDYMQLSAKGGFTLGVETNFLVSLGSNFVLLIDAIFEIGPNHITHWVRLIVSA